MEAVIKIQDENGGGSELRLKSLVELDDTTTRFDQAGVDYTLEYRKIR